MQCTSTPIRGRRFSKGCTLAHHRTQLRNLGWALGTAIVGTLLITFLLSGLALGINGSGVLPQEDKDNLTVVVTQNTREMTRDEIAAEAEVILCDISLEEILGIAAIPPSGIHNFALCS